MITQQQYDELKTERDALAYQAKNLEAALRQRKLIHVGFTNENQVRYVTELRQGGGFYPDTENECYIPLYMLEVHAHRAGSDSKIYKEHCELWNQRNQIAEIRAEAARAGFIDGYCVGHKHGWIGVENKAEEFAEQYAEEKSDKSCGEDE